MRYHLTIMSCESIGDLEDYIPPQREGRDWFSLQIDIEIERDNPNSSDCYYLYWCSKVWWEIKEFEKQQHLSKKYHIITETYDIAEFKAIIVSFLESLNPMTQQETLDALAEFAISEFEERWILD